MNIYIKFGAKHLPNKKNFIESCQNFTCKNKSIRLLPHLKCTYLLGILLGIICISFTHSSMNQNQVVSGVQVNLNSPSNDYQH